MAQQNKQFQRTEDGHLILMSPEDRTLLIFDLIPRIQHGVICMIERVDDFGPRFRNEKLTGFGYEEDGNFYFDFYGLTVNFAEKVKPYLRSLSTMTEEEKKELSKRYVFTVIGDEIQIRYHSEGLWDDDTECSSNEYIWLINWLNKHHFDYNGLIRAGLAFEAKEGMYDIK
jgi:hypothetical protein